MIRYWHWPAELSFEGHFGRPVLAPNGSDFVSRKALLAAGVIRGQPKACLRIFPMRPHPLCSKQAMPRPLLPKNHSPSSAAATGIHSMHTFAAGYDPAKLANPLPVGTDQFNLSDPRWAWTGDQGVRRRRKLADFG